VVIQKNTGPETDPARLSVVLAGELFGFGEAWLDNYYTSATALAECRLLAIAREDFIRHFMAVPVLRERVLRGFSEMVRILIAKSVAGSGLNELAWFLRNMSTRYGRVEKDWIQIRKKLRQPEIAAVLNLSREHVTRLFAQLRAKGAVRFNRGYPRIARAWLDRAAPDRDLADSIRYRAAAL
jgi:CRP/FNR family transcriptional regulator